MTERTDRVYLVVTVLKTKNRYRLRVRRPTSLAPNEFCYGLGITIDKEDWFKRIAEVNLGRVVPPNLPKPDNFAVIVEKDTALKVLDRLAGRE